LRNLAECLENSFSEIDSDICAYLRDSDDEYAAMWYEMIGLQRAFPIIPQMMEGDCAVSLSAEEGEALVRYLGLKHSMENIERKKLYFQGHTDNYAYLKKIGAI